MFQFSVGFWDSGEIQHDGGLEVSVEIRRIGGFRHGGGI
jgi:hypothetical protein